MNLETKINNIKNYLLNIGKSKIKLAIGILILKRSEYWRSTRYGSWRKFCDEHIALSQSSIYRYIKTAELAEDNKFTSTNLWEVVQAIGWSKVQLGLTKIGKDELITTEEFIKRYKDINLNERVTYSEDNHSLIGFTFNLPEATASILTKELLVRGMRITNNSRSNMSAAMVTLVKDLMEEE